MDAHYYSIHLFGPVAGQYYIAVDGNFWDRIQPAVHSWTGTTRTLGLEQVCAETLRKGQTSVNITTGKESDTIP